MQFDIKKISGFLVIFAFFAIILLLINKFGKTIVDILLPFFIAKILARLLSPPTKYLTKVIRLPKPVCCGLVVVAFFAVLISFIVLLSSRLLRELMGLSAHLEDFANAFPEYVYEIKRQLTSSFPFFKLNESSGNGISQFFESFLLNISEAIIQKLSSALPRLAAFVPRLVIGGIVTMLATFYFTADLAVINRFVLFQFPHKIKVLLSEIRKQFFNTISRYLVAYLTLAAMTFAELFSGLVLMRKEYALIIALIITLVDILPFLGTGAILLPWGGFLLINGDTGEAVKIFVLYAVIAILRQIAEPKVIGSFTGLYPPIALLMIYAGAKLFGVLGIFVMPIVAIIIKNLNEKGIIHLYKLPPEKPCEHISRTRKKYKRFKKSL